MYKKYFENKKLILFDLDGTIVASEPLWKEAFEAVLTSIGYPGLSRNLPAGNSLADSWDYLLTTEDIKPQLTLKQLVEATHNSFLQLFLTRDIGVQGGFWEFAMDLLERGYKLGLTTNTDKSVATRMLDKLKITKLFELQLFGTDVKNPKPSPDIYIEAAKRYKLSSKEVLVFEDSVAGTTAAVRAHMDVICIWDAALSEREYPAEVLMFLPDFTPFQGNLDKTFDEVVQIATEKRKKN